MSFEADLIQFLQENLRCGFMDIFGQVLSFFGTELFFMIIAVVIYWCVDKRFGHRFFNVYILGVAVTNVMKVGFSRTRPFEAYPDKVASVGDPEVSKSFPSGHTESISSVTGMLTIKYGKKFKFIPIVGAVLTVLVMFSRLYLGQHYLSDVFAGLTCGLFFAMAFNALMALFKDKEEWMLIPAVVLTAVLLGVLGGLGKLDASEDLLKGLGAFLAFDIGYFMEKKLIKYDVRARHKAWAYILRVVIGGAVTVGLQYGLKAIIPDTLPMLRYFGRYFLMAFWASFAAPALFKGIKI